MKGERIIAVEKITGYPLADDHPKGGPKARFFKLFGFDEKRPADLHHSLLAHPDQNDVMKAIRTTLGTKSVVVCCVQTPDGRNPCINTVWVLDTGSKVHRLVTAYPANQ